MRESTTLDIFQKKKMKVITYSAEVTSGYLGTVTGKILFVQSGLLYLAHHCQL